MDDSSLKKGRWKVKEEMKSNRTQELVNDLTEVWERSVKKTHLFLSDGEISAIREYVPGALAGIEHLIVEYDEDDNPVAFMGIEDERLEMLFIDPDLRGRGLGRRLLEYGMEGYGVSSLSVNEQNPEALGFYRHLGFRICGRSEYDDQGNPYPVLYMERKDGD